MDDNLTPPRAHDTELMQLFIRTSYWRNELAMLNQCRMYTRTIFLSNICNVTGTKLKQHCWNNPLQSESIYQWPLNPKPTPTEWRFWQQALQQMISLRCNLTLPIPLGKWMSTTTKTYWWFYHPGEGAVFHHTPSGTTRHRIFPRQSRTQMFYRQGEGIKRLPPQLKQQVSPVVLQDNKVILTRNGSIKTHTSKINTLWLDQLTTTMLAKDWKLNIHHTRSEHLIWEAIIGQLLPGTA